MLRKLKILVSRIIYRLKEATKPKIEIKEKSIVVDKRYWNVDVKMFQNNAYTIVKVDNFYRIKKNSYDNIIAYIGMAPKEKLLSMKNLQWLQIVSHGYNGYDNLALYSNKNVVVTNLHNIYSEAMAQFCVSMWYGYNCYSIRKLISKIVDIKNTYTPSERVSVIIYGLGDIGSEIARLCKMQSWYVVGVKRNLVSNVPEYVDEVVSFEASKEILPKFDYVINVLPETTETKGIYDKKFFAGMKKTALFCNVGRGTSVVDVDLENAVQNGEIRGAILDACSSYKYSHPNIVLTGHSSSFAYKNAEKINNLFFTQLKLYIEKNVSELLYKIPLNG